MTKPGEATTLAPDLRERRAELFRDEPQDQLAEIGSRMERRWPRIVFGTLVAAATAVPGLASAVYAAFGGAKDDWRGNSAAYAALARERFGTSGHA